MKKWVILFVLIVLLGAGGSHYLKESVGDALRIEDGKALETFSRKDGIAIHVTEEQIYEGNLLLVNREHPVHQQGVKSDVVNLSQHEELMQGYGLLDNTIRLSESVAQKFLTMVDAANQDGVNHFLISSGYRDEMEQEQLYQEMGADVALPAGYSEHNLGLSLDIGSSEGQMGQAPEGKWLKENAWKYGFILRYPEDKTAITGIEYEPWHFRYVGLPHSMIMLEKGFALEEYLNYLKEKRYISATIDGEEYEIAYYPVVIRTSIHVPANRDYEISGNNMDGVIVTVNP
ncbi:M15 family metallopeptidase [Paenibacillus sp. P96]|uniref:M15 family metallopeptidase n=1 Tax=Paenibacillus zeirhizosphaerae TaxID=2987519 RepID=A0ABT9FLF1_9BACL|nr:M15 family metallopeptidase [Paenibacillus sp. P96]MDP4095566.1 M15 family metallopeptidase [Paenibacillus sp. P96]